MQAELSGDTEAKQRLLKLALQRDPDDAAARWQSGQVKHDNRWMLASRAAFLNAIQDERISQYQQLRDRFSGNVAGEIHLARWCRNNDMPDRERMHWRNVLAVDSNNSEALKGLKLRNFRGRLMTKEQIESFKEGSLSHQRALRHWGPKLNILRRDIKRTSSDPESDAWNSLTRSLFRLNEFLYLD